MKVAIIGAGAAGCFCAINLKQICPDLDISIYEGGKRALAKVAVTGGGRCNLTNTFRNVSDLKQVYPRGEKLMKRTLKRFSNQDTWEWFEAKGVALVAQEDECVFPVSQDAMQIVNTLLREIHRLGIHLHTSQKVKEIRSLGENRYALLFVDKEVQEAPFDFVVVCTGGHPNPKGFDMLSPLHLDIVPPLPSLFTLSIGNWRQDLMGIVIEEACLMIPGTKFKSTGALLLTHWGMSGPVILKLTSYAARHLAENQYKGELLVNWMGQSGEGEIREILTSHMQQHANKLVTSVYPTQLTARLWHYLLERSNIAETQRWGSLNKKEQNRLLAVLSSDTYPIINKYPFKEEFVTCGGVSLGNININTLEAKEHPGLFFAGEVLDVDAITGGFNLQAAWSMAYVISQEIASKIEALSPEVSI